MQHTAGSSLKGPPRVLKCDGENIRRVQTGGSFRNLGIMDIDRNCFGLIMRPLLLCERGWETLQSLNGTCHTGQTRINYFLDTYFKEDGSFKENRLIKLFKYYATKEMYDNAKRMIRTLGGKGYFKEEAKDIVVASLLRPFVWFDVMANNLKRPWSKIIKELLIERSLLFKDMDENWLRVLFYKQFIEGYKFQKNFAVSFLKLWGKHYGIEDMQKYLGTQSTWPEWVEPVGRMSMVGYGTFRALSTMVITLQCLKEQKGLHKQTLRILQLLMIDIIRAKHGQYKRDCLYLLLKRLREFGQIRLFSPQDALEIVNWCVKNPEVTVYNKIRVIRSICYHAEVREELRRIYLSYTEAFLEEDIGFQIGMLTSAAELIEDGVFTAEELECHVKSWMESNLFAEDIPDNRDSLICAAGALLNNGITSFSIKIQNRLLRAIRGNLLSEDFRKRQNIYCKLDLWLKHLHFDNDDKKQILLSLASNLYRNRTLFIIAVAWYSKLLARDDVWGEDCNGLIRLHVQSFLQELYAVKNPCYLLLSCILIGQAIKRGIQLDEGEFIPDIAFDIIWEEIQKSGLSEIQGTAVIDRLYEIWNSLEVACTPESRYKDIGVWLESIFTKK